VLFLDIPSPAGLSKHRFKFQVPIKRERLTYRPLAVFAGVAPVSQAGTVLFKRPDFQPWLDKYETKRQW
jgi:hypothetical protein